MNEIITNGDEIKERILYEINKAKDSIKLAMAFFTDGDIALSLVNAKSNGVDVEVVLSSNLQNEKIKLLLKGGNIKVHAFETGDSRGIMHHKFCLIDNKITLHGSFNYTYNASKNNVENIQVTDELQTVNQFNEEFERIKFNIENQMNLDDIEIKNQEINISPKINDIEAFTKQLTNLIYSSTDVNPAEYKRRGYERSKATQGNLDIFRTEYNSIQNEINVMATNEGLNNRKDVLIANISSVFESKKVDIKNQMDDKIKFEVEKNELEYKNLEERIQNIKNEIRYVERGNAETGEKGIFELKSSIEIINEEIKNLSLKVDIKRFWRLGTVIAIVLGFIFCFYLTIFFSSAFYKMTFEQSEYRTAIEIGGTITMPKLVDAGAISHIYEKYDWIYTVMASFFFIIPLLLSNLKFIKRDINEYLNKIMFFVGLFIFDVIVSYMVAKQYDEIKSLSQGLESTISFFDVITMGEFWLIFLYGMIPLFITHFIIESIITSYRNSKLDIVNSEISNKIKLFNIEILKFNQKIETLEILRKEKENEIKNFEEKLRDLSGNILETKENIKFEFQEKLKHYKIIFEDFVSRTKSGKIFTEEIFKNLISAFKTGFIEFLPEHFASDVVAQKVKEINLFN